MTTKMTRIPSGINSMDTLIEGGFEKGSSILVVGTPGAGKTTFGLQFLYYGAIKNKEPGIFITFDESKDAIQKHYMEYGWDFEDLEKKGLFKILEYRPHQVNKLMEEGGGIIKDAIKSIDAKRLVFDSVTGYALLFKDEYQKRESIVNLFEMLKKLGLTTIFTAEDSTNNVVDSGVSYLTDAIIQLRYENVGKSAKKEHVLEIIKMRGTKHTDKVCPFEFDKNGIKVCNLDSEL
jgi:circadian clock protein KaiC